MRPQTRRTLLLTAIALIVISELLRQVVARGGALGAATTALLVAVVYAYCGHRASTGRRHQGWILAPTLLFTLLPTGVRLYRFFAAAEPGWLERLWQLLPFVLSFLLPIVLLVVVYVDLGRRSRA